MERASVDAEERAARLAEVLHRQADDRAEHQHRVHDRPGMVVGPGEFGVEIHGVPVAHRSGEERGVGVGDGAAPVMLEHLPDGEVLELVALTDRRKRLRIERTHHRPPYSDRLCR